MQVSNKLVLNGSETWVAHSSQNNETTAVFTHTVTNFSTLNNDIICDKFSVRDAVAMWDISFTEEGISKNGAGYIRVRILKSKLSSVDVVGFKAWLQSNPIAIHYGLGTPIITPIPSSGILLSNPSGTVYWEKAVADAGIYNGEISVLIQDLPIESLDKLSMIDFETGLETELDPSQAVIAPNGLSFTHPDLADNDIVFFTCYYDKQSIVPEMSVEFYDSRYVIKDSVTEKFYKWNVKVENGAPSIDLVEV